MSRVTLKSISKSFGNQSIIPSLSLDIRSNEFVSLLGPSGCGKTTLIRMIAGLELPTQGQIKIGDEVVYDSDSKLFVPPEKRNLGMVFQSYALWPHLSVFENIAFPLRCRKVIQAEMNKEVLTVLDQVQLGGMEKRKINELSGGQQQRVALARALVARPRVLLLDEPLSNLDANLREEMCEQIAKIKSQYPMTMIYVTHDQKEAVRLSDRIVILNQGEIEQIGTVQELKDSPRSEFVRGFFRV